jgi:hypothetical protein
MRGRPRRRRPRAAGAGSAPVWLHVPCTATVGKISFLGNYDGIRVLPDWWDLGVVVVFSVAVFFLGVRMMLSRTRG